MQLVIEENIDDEEAAFGMLLKACGGGGETNTEDTTNTIAEIDACKGRLDGAKQELKEAMLKFMDAIERTTSDDIFIETELSSKRKKPYHRAACLLKQFGCATKVKHIKRLREEMGVAPTPVTSAQLRYQRRLKYLTESELSFIKSHGKRPVTSPEPEEEYLMPEELPIIEEEVGLENTEELFSENEASAITENEK
ncbi:uncharacterized protein [Halyomorpha halys]